jgi:hypothetical protein
MGKARWIEHSDFTLDHVPRSTPYARYKRYRRRYRMAVRNIMRRAIMTGRIGNMYGTSLVVSKRV